MLYFPSFIIYGQINNLDSLEKYNYKTYDLVILGEVINQESIKLNNNSYSFYDKVIVYETFKGKPTKYIYITMYNENSYLLFKAGLWLIYANKINDTLYYISDRSLTRSNIYPKGFLITYRIFPLIKKV